VPTPNLKNETNRAGGVPLDNDIVRAGLNYKIDWQHWGLGGRGCRIAGMGAL
jgi:hypothetical protein